MSDHADELLHAARQERRRLLTLFTVAIVLFGGTLTAGWAVSATRAEQEHQDKVSAVSQARQDYAALLGKYTELYDEFTRTTGKEPAATAPDKVPVKGDPGDPGIPGPVGPAGSTGEKGDKGDTGTPGTNGAAGADGTTGDTGAQGASGPAGPQGDPGPTGPQGAPGATGAQGEPGPTCPDGSTAQTRWILAADSETATPTFQQIIVCVPTTPGKDTP